jgi:hypothetical protein
MAGSAQGKHQPDHGEAGNDEQVRGQHAEAQVAVEQQQGTRHKQQRGRHDRQGHGQPASATLAHRGHHDPPVDTKGRGSCPMTLAECKSTLLSASLAGCRLSAAWPSCTFIMLAHRPEIDLCQGCRSGRLQPLTVGLRTNTFGVIDVNV